MWCDPVTVTGSDGGTVGGSMSSLTPCVSQAPLLCHQYALLMQLSERGALKIGLACWHLPPWAHVLVRCMCGISQWHHGPMMVIPTAGRLDNCRLHPR